jgi:phospholipase C
MAKLGTVTGVVVKGGVILATKYAPIVLKENFNLIYGGAAKEFNFTDGIGPGTIEVCFQTIPGNPHAGTSIQPSGKGAYVDIIHDGRIISNTLTDKPGKGKVATASIGAIDNLWKLVFKNTNENSGEDGEDYFVSITYPSTNPIKVKKIPMSFWQRAFDNFWNNYKPIEYLKINYDHNYYGDQYSITEILYLVGVISNRIQFIVDLNFDLLTHIPTFPIKLSTETRLIKLSIYYKEFAGMKIINCVNEHDLNTRQQFISKVQKIAFDHPEDRDFIANIYPHSGEIYDLLVPYVLNDTLEKRSSHKVIISLNDEIATLYNHNSHFIGVKEVVLDLPELRTSGFAGGSAKIHNIKANNIQFSTIKNSPSPGIHIKFSFETFGSVEIETHIGSQGIDYLDNHINSLTIEPEITLEMINVIDDAFPNNWGKKYVLSARLNFRMDPNISIEYPSVGGSISFNRDDLIDIDFHAEWVETDLNTLANQMGMQAGEKYLSVFTAQVMTYLLGDNYPVMDIKLANDNILITYVANPESQEMSKIVQPTPYKIPAQNNLSKVDHIVVVMMENRSFDHMLGYLKLEGGRKDVDGLTGNESNADFQQNIYKVSHNPNTQILQDPCHASSCVKRQIGTNMDGFIKDFSLRYKNNKEVWGNVMSYYNKIEVPTFDYLSKEFAICDKWFCAHPGQTQPNRFITYTGKLNNDSQGKPQIDNINFSDFTPIETPTIFDYLTKCNVSWKVFEHGYSFIRLFTNYTFDTNNVVDFNSPKSFNYLAQAGKLPSVSFIEPDYIDVPPGNDDHPPGDIKKGQAFLAGIIKALQESPKWEKTMLIITYDEHGGFYDHVLPPDNAIELAGGIIRYGPRVPSFVISPYVPEGSVSHVLFDHTSILATIIKRFISPDLHQYLDLGPRISTSNDIGTILSLSTPRKNITPVNIPTFPVLNPTNYKMAPPKLANNDFHATLFGYRLMLGYPPK